MTCEATCEATRKPITIYKMVDKSDKFTIKNEHIFNLPMRLLAIGRTGCGKSSVALGNLLLRPEFYRNSFLPENIFIFSGSLKGDLKLKTIINELEIPEGNLFDSFNEEEGHIIYDNIVENFNNDIEEKQKPAHSLFIFDDLGFTNLQNKNNKNSILDRIFCNGRKYLISTITLNQRITQLSTTARSQASCLMLWSVNNKELDLVESSFNYLEGGKKAFNKMVKDNTQDMHDFIVMDLEKTNIYRDKEFKPIKI